MSLPSISTHMEFRYQYQYQYQYQYKYQYTYGVQLPVPRIKCSKYHVASTKCSSSKPTGFRSVPIYFSTSTSTNGHICSGWYIDPQLVKMLTQLLQDDYTANNFGQQETRDGYSAQGEYFVNLPDGRLQKVIFCHRNSF